MRGSPLETRITSATKALAEIHRRSIGCAHINTTKSLYYAGRWQDFCQNCGMVRFESMGLIRNPERWIKYNELDFYL
jgi:hypothetical protein